MPYILDKNRFELTPETTLDAGHPGDLNFQLTCLVIDYLNYHGPSYGTMNDIVGALECCKQEFYRRVVIPHEDQAIKRNGDVYNV